MTGSFADLPSDVLRLVRDYIGSLTNAVRFSQINRATFDICDEAFWKQACNAVGYGLPDKPLSCGRHSTSGTYANLARAVVADYAITFERFVCAYHRVPGSCPNQIECDMKRGISLMRCDRRNPLTRTGPALVIYGATNGVQKNPNPLPHTRSDLMWLCFDKHFYQSQSSSYSDILSHPALACQYLESPDRTEVAYREDASRSDTLITNAHGVVVADVVLHICDRYEGRPSFGIN